MLNTRAFLIHFFSDNRRHARFLTRLQSLTANPTTAVPVIKAATRGYRLAETTARDLILTIWNVVDQKLEHTASIVNAFVDLVDEEEKKQDILASWKSFEIEVCIVLCFSLYIYYWAADLILNASNDDNSQNSSRHPLDRSMLGSLLVVC